jgi:hypothetical protein
MVAADVRRRSRGRNQVPPPHVGGYGIWGPSYEPPIRHGPRHRLPYMDNGPLLASGKPELRDHKRVYVQNDAEIGLFSDEVVVNCAPWIWNLTEIAVPAPPHGRIFRGLATVGG